MQVVERGVGRQHWTIFATFADADNRNAQILSTIQIGLNVSYTDTGSLQNEMLSSHNLCCKESQTKTSVCKRLVRRQHKAICPCGIWPRRSFMYCSPLARIIVLRISTNTLRFGRLGTA